MDMPVVATALEPHKRLRDTCSSLVSEELAEQAPAAKKICRLLGEDVNISSLLDDASEANESFDQNELDEDQEKLVYGVMRSLEEELGVSDLASTSATPVPEGQALDSSSLPVFREEACFAEDFALHSGGETSTSCAGELESFELPSLLEGVYDYNEKSSTITDANALVSVSINGAENGTDSTAELYSEKCKLLDIGYLLEASDDELGIAPSPSTGSFSSETDLFSGNLQGADSTASNNDIVDVEPWQVGWDCSSENFFELANDGEFTNQELFRRSISTLDIIFDPSTRGHTSLETSSTYLEPAGASH